MGFGKNRDFLIKGFHKKQKVLTRRESCEWTIRSRPLQEPATQFQCQLSSQETLGRRGSGR
uniref:Uncharacterized protein n=1 Tax=Rhizophora mucronata TaxID=61149 RepID=A0A2P2P9B1_RHIMU